MTSAISIESISKSYQINKGTGEPRGYRTLRESVMGGLSRGATSLKSIGRDRQTSVTRSGVEDFWSLKDVSLRINQAEVIGLIGRNGAGKSTLLKILSRITEPTSGRVEIRGRVGSLLEVGTGFHTELSGRENIYLNGAICGMKRREIDRKFDEIVDFADIGQFLDTPVKRYSSGMFVRLAFGVAAHMEPEILLVDEVLAVGDAAFQKKCLGKMNEVSRSGRTVVLVSHNMASILNLCDRVALLERGRLVFDGPSKEGIERYVDSGRQAGGDISLVDHSNRRVNSRPILGRVRLLDQEGRVTDQVACGEPISIEIETHPECTPGDYHFAVGFDDSLGCRLMTAATYLSNQAPTFRRDMASLRCDLDELALTPGRYCLTLNAGPREWVWTDVVDHALWFDVIPTDFYGNGRLPNPDWGHTLIRSRWSESQADASGA